MIKNRLFIIINLEQAGHPHEKKAERDEQDKDGNNGCKIFLHFSNQLFLIIGGKFPVIADSDSNTDGIQIIEDCKGVFS